MKKRLIPVFILVIAVKLCDRYTLESFVMIKEFCGVVLKINESFYDFTGTQT